MDDAPGGGAPRPAARRREPSVSRPAGTGKSVELYFAWASALEGRDDQNPRQTAHQGAAENAAAAALQGHLAQRRLYAARVRRAGAQGGVPHERRPGLPGDDDGAPARRLRHRRLRPGRRGDQGQGRDRARQEQGLPAVLHHRARGVGASHVARMSAATCGAALARGWIAPDFASLIRATFGPGGVGVTMATCPGGSALTRVPCLHVSRCQTAQALLAPNRSRDALRPGFETFLLFRHPDEGGGRSAERRLGGRTRAVPDTVALARRRANLPPEGCPPLGAPPVAFLAPGPHSSQGASSRNLPRRRLRAAAAGRHTLLRLRIVSRENAPSEPACADL